MMITGLDEYFSAHMRKPATKFKATGLIVNGEKLRPVLQGRRFSDSARYPTRHPNMI
jgi:hypothetical protein